MIKKITEVGRRWFSPTTIRRIGAFMLMASMALGTATVAFADDDDDDDDCAGWCAMPRAADATWMYGRSATIRISLDTTGADITTPRDCIPIPGNTAG